MDKKKKLLILVVGVLTVTIVTVFWKMFSFENKDGSTDVSAYYPYINDNLIEKLYSYIPEDYLDRSTVYGSFYTKYPNLSLDVVLLMVYNYIVNNDYFEMLSLSEDELKQNLMTSEDVLPLYKVSLEVFERDGKIVFGNMIDIPKKSFAIDGKVKALYVEGVGFYFYEMVNQTVDVDYIIERKYDKYVVTNNNDTIYIYDYFVKCDKVGYTCYNDEKRKEINSVIKNVNGNSVNLENNLNYAKGYKHTFKFEDGHYYWYSSESIDKGL